MPKQATPPKPVCPKCGNSDSFMTTTKGTMCAKCKEIILPPFISK